MPVLSSLHERVAVAYMENDAQKSQQLLSTTNRGGESDQQSFTESEHLPVTVFQQRIAEWNGINLVLGFYQIFLDWYRECLMTSIYQTTWKCSDIRCEILRICCSYVNGTAVAGELILRMRSRIWYLAGFTLVQSNPTGSWAEAKLGMRSLWSK